MCFCAEYMYAASALSTASASLLQLVFFLSFGHVMRSSIRALADGRPAVTPVRVIRPLSPPLHWAALTYLPRSPSAPHPRARPNNGAQINALHSTRSARHSARRKRPRHQGETPRSHSCRASFLSHHAHAHCNLALAPTAPPLRPAVVPAGWASADVRCVFSHGHLGECVCCNVA